jgi:Protein of unknown function (DUF1553)/Protein of unknown function (DUF1549)/Planctomycete cytochrome C
MKKIRIIVLFVFGAGLFTFLLIRAGNRKNGVSKEAAISYNFQVRPILSDKCFNCHGPDANKRQAGLRLDIREEAYKALRDNPGSHAIVPGDPSLSELYLRVSSGDTAIQMPPPSSHLPSLSEGEIAIIKKWIRQGAVYEKHWSFIAPVKPALPEVKNEDWPKNEIDFFVLDQMEKHGLSPNEQADRERLLKRWSLDITGLLPDPELTDSFINDKSKDAYSKMVDRLLAQPSFGERMAIPWMDVARFADSHGYQDDNYRSQWPWRDWVIHSFNTNMPYDQFVTWQLAGDLLPNASKEQILATGFNRNHKITEEGGVIDEEYRVEYVVDRTNTLGRAFMGVTVECAKCHDHKYDPISQKDFYQLTAFFNNINEKGIESTVGGPETYAKTPSMAIKPEDLKGLLAFINKPDNDSLKVSVMKDKDTARQAYILVRGNYDQHGLEVSPGTPNSILPFPTDYPKNRLGLAKWLFNEKNPLTSRVFVNRMWQEFFGRGIVKSAADFGMQGDLPTNPALLDWLAVDFREHGWNIKRLVKQMVLSSTYCQSAELKKAKQQADPENIWLSRSPRVRMNAEMIRDMVLASSGLLNRSIGGPSVKPYQPAGLWEMATSGRGSLATYRQDHGSDLYRRGLYTFIKRTVPPPSMMIFDASNRDQCEVRRLRTNTPLQALVMMNDPTVLEASLAMADNALKTGGTPEEMVRRCFRKIICRQPEKKEMAVLTDYWKDQEDYFRSNPKAAAATVKVGEYKRQGQDIAGMAALMRVIQVMYNMEEAITKT